MEEKLAIEGGTPVRQGALPSVGDISGRNLGEQEIANLTEVIKSGNLFRYGGRFVVGLETEFARLLGMGQAVACTSGTAAIHLAVAGVNPSPGDEIITSPITDMGTISPIIMQNAIPVFADLDAETFNLDPASVAECITERTKAIIVVHLMGGPADMDALLALARPRGIKVIEDCCQAYLAEDRGRLVGTIGDVGCFSLQQSKHMTAGDGGIVVTNDEALAGRMRLFADKGWARGGEVRDYLQLGINYRMNELTGAVAYAQVGKVASVVARRRQRAEQMTRLLAAQAPGVNPPVVRAGGKHSYWQYPITIDEGRLGVGSADFCQAINAEGVPAGVGYIGRPIYLSAALRTAPTYGDSRCPFDCPRASRRVQYQESDCPHTVEILRRIIIIPWNENYSEQEVADLAAGIGKVARHYAARGAGQ